MSIFLTDVTLKEDIKQRTIQSANIAIEVKIRMEGHILDFHSGNQVPAEPS